MLLAILHGYKYLTLNKEFTVIGNQIGFNTNVDFDMMDDA